MHLNNTLQERYAKKFVHTTQQVLVERVSTAGIAEGHTENYLLTKFTVQKAQHATIVPVLLTNYLAGEYMEAREL